MKVDQTREAVTMKVAEKRRWKILLVAGATMALVAEMASTLPSAYAGGTIKANDDQWISIGMGIRTKLSAVQDGQANGQGYGTDFGVDNARVYINGKIHKYVGFTFNTDCFNCNSSAFGGGIGGLGTGTMGLLDAIGKFEFNDLVNLWVGRTLVPGERGELNGPFYHATFEGFKTPFNSADFTNTGFGAGGAGLYGRDNGVVLWGSMLDHHLSYAASVFTGLRSSGGATPSGPNQQGSLLYAGRVTYNFFNKEDNPGYYTSGTYYGTAGHILAIAGGINYQANGAGSLAAPSDMTVLVSDILWELPLGKDMQGGVITVNGEFKHYAAGYDTAVAFAPGTTDCFCMFRGQSYTAYALYLFPGEIGIGRFQPYARYTTIQAAQSSVREEVEFGTNYIISGHNARISAFYQYGDIATKGLGNWAPNAPGADVSAFKLALQLQY